MPDILEHPDAQALLDQATVGPTSVAACTRHLTAFLGRYLPLFYRDDQRDHADVILRGKLTSLERKSTEPIARQAHLKRRPLQQFLGAGKERRSGAWPDGWGAIQRHQQMQASF